MKLSIVIPCFNEVDTISKLLEAVMSSPVENKEIIIVDDGSTDGTRDSLALVNDPQIQIIYCML